MKVLTVILFSVLLSALMVTAGSIPVAIERAEIDDTEIDVSGKNILDIERDQEFELELELRASEDVDDVEIRAFISGYEYNDVRSISDSIGPIDLDANVTYVRRMDLSLPDDVDVDDYKLRLIISDRNGEEAIYTYDLQINTERHKLKIEDVYLSPGHSITAGQALLATVRLENKGQKDEDDVKVTVSIPALGVSDTDYIDEIEEDEEEETEELFLRLPKCAEAGVYDVNVDVWYNNDHDKESGTMQINVLENPSCAPEPEPVVVVQEAEPEAPVEEASSDSAGKVRAALEVILLVLVALLVIVGLVIGFTRMRE